MKTYSVNQVAEMLQTNPETVRRWIRDAKLTAIQPAAKKDGIKITEEALSSFVENTPKFIPLYDASKAISIAAVAGLGGGLISGLVAGALLGFLKAKKSTDYRVTSADFKKYLQKSVDELDRENQNKRDQIRKAELEISENKMKIEQYKYLLENEDLMSKELEKNNK